VAGRRALHPRRRGIHTVAGQRGRVHPGGDPDSGASDAAAPAPSQSADEGDIARRLLADLASCAREQAADCSDILEDPSAGVPDGVVVEDAELREVTLLDEYGGVAAYRVSGGQQPARCSFSCRSTENG
jgi:hypothetical protein